ncbi:hypothetical protein ACEWY4_010218 [Coilia grayii]|uniref:Uncharacterized protein n=1 Tax=Coilia grayii TaxID=363190 RepID=A0ABD1K8U3_9TELE
MEAVCSLKLDQSIPLDTCIICKDSKRDQVFKATEQGLLTLKAAAEDRQRLHDINHREAIQRVLLVQNIQNVFWHRMCYASFTSKNHISRLQQKSCDSSADLDEGAGPSKRARTLPTMTRSSVATMKWDACMFCQEVNSKFKVSMVTTLNMSDRILAASKYDQVLSVQLASVSDLIAAEGRYHTPCYMKFLRKTTKTKDNSSSSDLAMEWLLEELTSTENISNVYELAEVWDRYCVLAETAEVPIPSSYLSRRSTFKEKLQQRLRNKYEFINLDQEILLVPVEFGHVPLSILLSEPKEDSLISKYTASEGFMELIHVALKLRGDILAQPAYKGFVVSEEEMISCIPDSLFMFLRVMFGGQSLLEVDQEDETAQNKEDGTQRKVLSIAQDLVYNISGGKRWTPKHLGLASTLHQATRSKELVELFHQAGHIISYNNLKQVDTALAECTLHAMDMDTGAVVPPNLVPDRFVHFTCDNIDINDSSLDGKNSFHATQVAGWQRGPEADMGLSDLRPSAKTTLQVPEIMEQLSPAAVVIGKKEPGSIIQTKKEWYNEQIQDNASACVALAKDMAFFIKRQDADLKKGWTNFNQTICRTSSAVTSIGYMPIVQAPAHELDTLNTVIQRCRHIATALGQQHVVLTVDEALYCKLMELKWAKDEYQDFLIVRMGGLHISLTFLKVIGKHIQSSGLMDAWIESGLFAPGTAEQVILGKGKSYSKAIRAHKITVQAMWRILMPKLMNFIQMKNQALRQMLEKKSSSEDIEDLLTFLASKDFLEILDSFEKSNMNPNFKFWWGYMEMVEILLMFTRAQREGNWNLHLHAFKRMIPFFMAYGHTNYARWGTIYVSEMHQLPQEVKKEFDKGNFVVKRTDQPFNEVDPDQSQEWLNGIGKKSGGIIGITKTSSALSRWALSYNLRSHIANETRAAYGLVLKDEYSHN